MVLRQDFLRKRRHEEEEKERKERESTRRMRRVSRHYFCCCLKFLETSPNLKSTGEILPICSNIRGDESEATSTVQIVDQIERRDLLDK
jgi:hypothetical protein